MKAALIAVVCTLIATPALAQSCPTRLNADPAMSAANEAWRQCIVQSANRLERSHDPAGDVATAALASCAKHEAHMRSVADAYCGPPTGRIYATEGEKALRDVAIAVVVERRAAR